MAIKIKHLKKFKVRKNKIASIGAIAVVLLFAIIGTKYFLFSHAATPVPGESYMICNDTSQYLTSPYTYDALASGTQTYTVAQYEALPGYGTTLPSLPSYISGEGSSAEAAEIFAPGSTVNAEAYQFPQTPIMYFFEGGAYSNLSLPSVSGDEFIGGSTSGFPEPNFNNNDTAGGINQNNGTYNFDGGSSTLATPASSGATTITTSTALPGYMNYITFADGYTDKISSYSGTSVTLNTALPNSKSGQVWFNTNAPVAEVSSSAAQGASSVTLGSSSSPIVQWGNYVIGTDNYQLTSVSGSQSAYTLGVSTGGLDTAVAANTPVYYNTVSGGVTVSYLDISNNLSNPGLTGAITTGAGWTITHNEIQDGYDSASAGTGAGVGILGGDEGTIEYNCLSKMGADAMAGWYGTNEKFDYNEIFKSTYQDDTNCGCTAAAKWWGTLNTDIVDNAWINDGIGAFSLNVGLPDIWLDNGNSGINISGNYFLNADSNAIDAETAFNLNITDNLFENGGWQNGSGPGNTNQVGAVDLNTSGGFNVPGSRYNNETIVSGNQFIDDWGGVNIWGSGLRSCLSSGEGWPVDAAYCSGGFPASSFAEAGGQYYFSHETNSGNGGTTVLAQSATAGSTTVMLQGDTTNGKSGAAAINDQIGFADPATTTTTDTTNVSTFSGSGVVNATTSGFPSSGQLRVSTSATTTGGGYTGAILSYKNTTSSTFTGVSLVRGTGTLSESIIQVQPYQVKSETCYANDCAVTVSPALSASEAAGTTVTSAGTCALFATSVATPTSPIAPDGTSYFDGCQWEPAHISVTGNNFVFDPSTIAGGTTVGGTVGTTCNSSNANDCGTNFMAFQATGDPPYQDGIDQYAMFSQSALTGCPVWDPGCTANPLSNLNTYANAPYGGTANNGEAAWNNVWSNNTYNGPWAWNAYNYDGCNGLPTDTATGKSPSGNVCQNISFSTWQSVWEQDLSSTYNASGSNTGGSGTSGSSNPSVSITSPSANTENYGTFAVNSTASANDGGSIASVELLVNGAIVQTLTSAPYNFNVNSLTANYHDGTYTIEVLATDDQGNQSSASQSIYIANGDLNLNHSVGIDDLAVMAANWTKTNQTYSQGNITGNGAVGIADLAILASNWGWSEGH